MTKAASLSLGLIVLVGSVLAQTPATDVAINESVRRTADTITLRKKIEDAAAAQARKDLPAAAKLYEDAWTLAQSIGPNYIESEWAATVNGVTAVQLDLAREAQKKNDLRLAKQRVDHVVKVNPKSAEGIALKKEIEAQIESQKGKVPDLPTQEFVTANHTNKVDSQTHVQNGRILIEAGKLELAEAELKKALDLDPDNKDAFFFLSGVKEARIRRAEETRDQGAQQSMVKVAQEWSPLVKRESLPVPNAYATNNLIHTGTGRQSIVSKITRIRLDDVSYESLPLSEVVLDLSKKAKKRDPEGKGLNFIVNNNTDTGGGGPTGAPAIDPTTSLPIPTAPTEAVDIGAISIRINPPLSDVSLNEVLDAIVKVADKPIKFSIEDYAIVFSLKGREVSPLYSRQFRVDPNTFYQGLESVGAFPVGGNIQSSSGGGGGRGGGGGGGFGGGGQGGGSIGIPRVNVAGGTGGGGGFGGQQGGGGGGGQGIRFVTRTNSMEEVHQAVRNFFTTMGVNLAEPGKSVFFADREGLLWVRATLQDLDIIEQVVQVLNVIPHQVHVQAKFAEITQNDAKATGFDWYLGNMLLNNRKIIASGGTAPTYNGFPDPLGRGGSFPGAYSPGNGLQAAQDTRLPLSTSDSLITGGLRNGANAPAIATFTGILTDPQFRLVIRAMEQNDAVDLLNAPEVTTPSGRQAQIQVVDLQTIVTGNQNNQTGGGGGGNLTGNTGNGVVASSINYDTGQEPFGTTLDVIPYISADGYTIQMTIIPTITEFVGYDDPGQFIPQVQSVSGGAGGVGIPLTAQLPLPRIRLRQVTTSAIVWDGQTVVLGGLISENVSKFKDRVPFLGGLPLVGKLFRSESTQTTKKNLVIFVTPTIIDPAGNRMHLDGQMPFDKDALPAQAPVAPTAPAPTETK